MRNRKWMSTSERESERKRERRGAIGAPRERKRKPPKARVNRVLSMAGKLAGERGGSKRVGGMKGANGSNKKGEHGFKKTMSRSSNNDNKEHYALCGAHVRAPLHPLPYAAFQPYSPASFVHYIPTKEKEAEWDTVQSFFLVSIVAVITWGFRFGVLLLRLICI